MDGTVVIDLELDVTVGGLEDELAAGAGEDGVRAFADVAGLFEDACLAVRVDEEGKSHATESNLALANVKCYLSLMVKKARADSAALFVRLTKKEKRALDSAAERAGFKHVSEWLRVVKLREELALANA